MYQDFDFTDLQLHQTFLESVSEITLSFMGIVTRGEGLTVYQLLVLLQDNLNWIHEKFSNLKKISLLHVDRRFIFGVKIGETVSSPITGFQTFNIFDVIKHYDTKINLDLNLNPAFQYSSQSSG